MNEITLDAAGLLTKGLESPANAFILTSLIEGLAMSGRSYSNDDVHATRRLRCLTEMTLSLSESASCVLDSERAAWTPERLLGVLRDLARNGECLDDLSFAFQYANGRWTDAGNRQSM